VAAQQISNSFVIEIDGQALPADVDVASVVVDDHLKLPDAFAITFRDGGRTAVTKSGAAVGKPVKISVLSDSSPRPQPLLIGEITALEAEIHGGTSFTVVRGYDQSHRLFRGRSTASYRDMTYADVAQKVAGRASLKSGTIDSTSPTFKHITQANERDWEFLNRLARDVGFEVAVSEGRLNFRKPVPSSGAPGPGSLDNEQDLRLQVGANLLFLRAVLTAAEQVEDVEVRGWNPTDKKAVTHKAKATTQAIKNASGPDKMARAFPSAPLVSTSVPYSTEREVEAAAKALADEVASSFAEMEGQARGNPKLRAGAAVHIGLLGDPFDGKYVLSSTRHSYDADEGYVTAFVISGRQERSLYGLTGGSGAGSPSINGVVIALVDDVDDPDKNARVRLRFPWLDDTYVSDWARVASAGAGKDRGTVILPEVGDEVLVSFEQGDLSHPFVLGGLYNGKDTPNFGPGSFLDGSSKSVNNRVFTSRKGHQLVFIDGDSDTGISLVTGDGKTHIKLDQANNKVEVKTAGDVAITADGSVKIEAKGALELKGQSVKIEGQNTVAAKAVQVQIEASGSAKISGTPIQLN
jgi:phage protein D/phage baseplate assembly protein gpV